MLIKNLCPPALLYLVFSLTQIIIDIFKNMYNTAFFKFIVMILFTLGLNILCQRGLGVISWFIVFIPFILMTVITTLLLFVFGLSPSEGNLNYSVDYPKGGSGPLQPIPVGPIPVGPTPIDPIPVGPTPIDPIPVGPTPIDPIPVGPTPIDPIPVGPTPIDPTPVDPTPVEPTPVPAVPVPIKPIPSSITPSPVTPTPVVPTAPFGLM